MSTITDETLAQFKKFRMGWLSHEGELIPCRMYSHIEKLGEVPFFQDAYDRFKATCDENQAMMDADLVSLAEDEHPAMHRFDGMDDEAKQEFMKIVYTAGWIRLGHSFERPPEPHRAFMHPNDPRRRRPQHREADRWYVEAEGLTDAVRGQDTVLRDIADRMGCELRPREMKYTMVNFGSRSRPNEHEVLMPESHEEASEVQGFRR